MFDRVEVSIGGTQLSSGCNYANVLHAAKAALFESKTANLLYNHGEVVRKNSYVTGVALPNTEANVPCVARGFPGFLDVDAIFDSSLVGDIVVTLHTASTDVISASSAASPDFVQTMTAQGAATSSYTLSDLYASIEVIAIADPVYSAMSQRVIAERGFLEVSFKNTVSTVSIHNMATRFNVATQSLDRVWVCFRPVTNLGPNKPSAAVLGYDRASTSTANVHSYDNIARMNGEKYVPTYQVFKTPDANALFQLSMNGSLYPQFPADATAWSSISANGAPPGYVLRPDLSPNLYTQQNFVLCARLNVPGSESARVISGLDTRGVSLTASVNTQNDASGSNFQALIFSECTSSLRVGAGRVVEVIH